MTEEHEVKVFISSRASVCRECGAELASSAWIRPVEDNQVLCLACAELDHLEYLPSGDAALTRRAKKLSGLSAVVLKWSRARKRYERQGLLVEARGLEQAEAACLGDAEARQARSARRAEAEAELDRQFVQRFAEAIRARYPACPTQRELEIATHACRKYSGRIGRTADAKAFDPSAVDLAVVAHVRHSETNYDTLLMNGVHRAEARAQIGDAVRAVLERWTGAT